MAVRRARARQPSLPATDPAALSGHRTAALLQPLALARPPLRRLHPPAAPAAPTAARSAAWTCCQWTCSRPACSPRSRQRRRCGGCGREQGGRAGCPLSMRRLPATVPQCDAGRAACQDAGPLTSQPADPTAALAVPLTSLDAATGEAGGEVGGAGAGAGARGRPVRSGPPAGAALPGQARSRLSAAWAAGCSAATPCLRARTRPPACPRKARRATPRRAARLMHAPGACHRPAAGSAQRTPSSTTLRPPSRPLPRSCRRRARAPPARRSCTTSGCRCATCARWAARWGRAGRCWAWRGRALQPSWLACLRAVVPRTSPHSPPRLTPQAGLH